jgi:hypothetical protein
VGVGYLVAYGYLSPFWGFMGLVAVSPVAVLGLSGGGA